MTPPTSSLRLATLLLALGLTACGGEETKAVGESPTAEASTTGPTISVAETDLKRVCPEVETLLGPMPRFPERSDYLAFGEQVIELSLHVDSETNNALGGLYGGTSQAADADNLVAANNIWMQAIDAFAQRCKAAGSPALQ